MIIGIITVIATILAIYFFGQKFIDLVWKKAVDVTLSGAELREKFEKEARQSHVQLVKEAPEVKEKSPVVTLAEVKEVKIEAVAPPVPAQVPRKPNRQRSRNKPPKKPTDGQ